MCVISLGCATSGGPQHQLVKLPKRRASKGDNDDGEEFNEKSSKCVLSITEVALLRLAIEEKTQKKEKESASLCEFFGEF